MTTLDAQFTGRNVTVALEGVLKSTILPTMAFGGTQEPFTVIISNLFQLDATWQFQSGFSIGAPYDGESTFSGTLQSTGVVTKSAAP
jgi:predicted secreted protein